MTNHTTDGLPAGPLRILLVDDHEDTNRLLLLMLRRRGYVVQAATSISEALQAAAESEWDILVSDMGLPDGSGLDLLARMPSPPSMGGIVVSGHSEEEDIERSKAAGYREHLVKPVNWEKLDALIRRIAAESGR